MVIKHNFSECQMFIVFIDIFFVHVLVTENLDIRRGRNHLRDEGAKALAEALGKGPGSDADREKNDFMWFLTFGKMMKNEGLESFQLHNKTNPILTKTKNKRGAFARNWTQKLHHSDEVHLWAIHCKCSDFVAMVLGMKEGKPWLKRWCGDA